LSGTMDTDALAERLAMSEAAVIMKVGRNLAKIRLALTRTGKLDRAVYVERGTMPEEHIVQLADKQNDEATYLALVLGPGLRTPLGPDPSPLSASVRVQLSWSRRSPSTRLPLPPTWLAMRHTYPACPNAPASAGTHPTIARSWRARSKH